MHPVICNKPAPADIWTQGACMKYAYVNQMNQVIRVKGHTNIIAIYSSIWMIDQS